MKKIMLLVLMLWAIDASAAQQTILGGSGVEWGDEKVKINSNFTELYTQAFDANLTYDDVIATITANWVNTSHPWADNEVSDTLTVDIADAGGLITATTVEGALQENRTAIDLNTAKVIDNTAYNATSWDGNSDAATKDALRDKFETISAGGISNVVEDTTPQLGGNLDIQAYNIEGVDATEFGYVDGVTSDIQTQLDAKYESGDAITTSGLTVSPSATPGIEMQDSDDAAGTAEIYANSSGGANDIILSIGVEDSSGEDTEYIQVDGVSETVDFLKYTTLQAGDIVLAEMATDSVDYNKTTGSFKSLTPVTDDCDNFAANFTGANLYGGTFIGNAAGTCQLPAVAAGMNFCISTFGAVALVIEPNASDSFILDGVQLDDADSATNLSTAGDLICFQYLSAAGWLASSNGWTDED